MVTVLLAAQPGDATALIAANTAAGRKGGPKGEAASLEHLSRAWRTQGPTPASAMELALCDGCGRLLLRRASDRTPRRFHGPCRAAALGSRPGRLWLSDRLRMRRSGGMTKAEVDSEIGADPLAAYSGGLGRPRKNLTRDFAWAWRHYVLGELQADLASKWGASPPMNQAIAQILRLLPDPALRLDKNFARHMRPLRAALGG